MASKSSTYEICKNIASFLKTRTRHRPTIGLVIGSGLNELADMLEQQCVVYYKDINGFPVAPGHGQKARLIFGMLGDKCLICMQGRVHCYEGFTPDECALPIRVMKLLGVETLVIANSAGSLHGDFKIGDIMVINDHICLPAMTGLNPLTGVNDERFGDRFPDMANCYTSTYVDLIKLSAARLNMGWRLRQGVYAMISGPALSTNAECKFLRICGADAVGMSNCWEVMAARHCEMRVLAICVITKLFNNTIINDKVEYSRDELMDMNKRAVTDLQKILLDTIPKL